MTFSIVARCAETGQMGIAIGSSSIAVGARCPWLRPGVGAVSTQNITLPALGPDVLDLLEQGLAPADAVDKALTRTLPLPEPMQGFSRHGHCPDQARKIRLP